MLQPQLNSLYQDSWVKLNAILPKDREISNPLFIQVPDAYETAQLKLIVIGQQTNGWVSHLGDPEYTTTPEGLIKCYGTFNLGEKYIKSPFWQASHELQRKLAPSVPPFGFVWSNLFICDQNRRTPEDDVADKLRDLSILKDELRILQPDVAVFFTGWRLYDYTIKKLFPGIIITPVDGGDGKLLSQLSDPALVLPTRSYRTYHPKYLRMQKKMAVLDWIADKIKNSKNS
jgi:hypothetical protein